ncbi:unnamed protein product [Notodromas monacha]|uniref:Uncharacterized protein n=1 Tax=Notodromas monacha TaxID=399045 RepID=A0A7R9BRC6_9CRUS|nr:unnamed protein product [Notodromas monacha]CAG0920282.1 unnamed protein product [Notodromas monacha]
MILSMEFLWAVICLKVVSSGALPALQKKNGESFISQKEVEQTVSKLETLNAASAHLVDQHDFDHDVQPALGNPDPRMRTCAVPFSAAVDISRKPYSKRPVLLKPAAASKRNKLSADMSFATSMNNKETQKESKAPSNGHFSKQHTSRVSTIITRQSSRGNRCRRGAKTKPVNGTRNPLLDELFCFLHASLIRTLKSKPCKSQSGEDSSECKVANEFMVSQPSIRQGPNIEQQQDQCQRKRSMSKAVSLVSMYGKEKLITRDNPTNKCSTFGVGHILEDPVSADKLYEYLLSSGSNGIREDNMSPIIQEDYPQMQQYTDDDYQLEELPPPPAFSDAQNVQDTRDAELKRILTKVDQMFEKLSKISSSTTSRTTSTTTTTTTTTTKTTAKPTTKTRKPQTTADLQQRIFTPPHLLFVPVTSVPFQGYNVHIAETVYEDHTSREEILTMPTKTNRPSHFQPFETSSITTWSNPETTTSLPPSKVKTKKRVTEGADIVKVSETDAAANKMGRSRRKKKKEKKKEEPKMGCVAMGAVCLILAALGYLFVIEHFRKGRGEVEEDREPKDDCLGTQLYCALVAITGLLAIPRHLPMVALSYPITLTTLGLSVIGLPANTVDVYMAGGAPWEMTRTFLGFCMTPLGLWTMFTEARFEMCNVEMALTVFMCNWANLMMFWKKKMFIPMACCFMQIIGYAQVRMDDKTGELHYLPSGLTLIVLGFTTFLYARNTKQLTRPGSVWPLVDHEGGAEEYYYYY